MQATLIFFNDTKLMILCPGERWTKDSDVISSTNHTGGERYMAMGNPCPRFMSLLEKCKPSGRAAASSGAEKKGLTGNRNKTVICGWQHFSYAYNKYILMKNTPKNMNNGPRPVQLNKCLTKEQVIQECCHIFFPNGKNSKGKLTKMEVFLGNFKGEEVFFEQLLEYGKDKPHLYLHTKQKIPDFEIQSSSDSDDLPDPMIISNVSHTPVSQTTASLNTTPSSSIHQVQSGVFMASDYNTQQPSTSQRYIITPQNQPAQSGTPIHIRTPIQPQRILSSEMQQSQFGIPMPIQEQSQSTASDQNVTPRQQSTSSNWIQLDTPTVNISKEYLQQSLGITDDHPNKCNVCKDRDKNSVIIPCGHTFCMECATQVESYGQPCPVCRSPINVINPYFA